MRTKRIVYLVIGFIGILLPGSNTIGAILSADVIKLDSNHIAAANRQRRIIHQYDFDKRVFLIDGVVTEQLPEHLNDAMDYLMSPFDEKGHQIDSVWLDGLEGDTAIWESKILPRSDTLNKWCKAGIDPIKVVIDKLHERNLEVFFSYRISTRDMPKGHAYATGQSLLRKQYPDWVIGGHWNFAKQGVRDLKLSILKELAENMDVDGISIDFARIPFLFSGSQNWLHKDILTDFMRDVRLALIEVGKKRSRPILLAARVPATVMGCHFDGFDIERWAREHLVDMLVLGIRSNDIDIAAFREATLGTDIKLYPSFDEFHSSDNYRCPSIEIYRGVCSNWWNQGVDGIHLFNFCYASPEMNEKLGLSMISILGVPADRWDVQKIVFEEVGNPHTLRYKDKVFIVERRGGGHAPVVVPSPSNWHTPRVFYMNTNMLAQLPAPLDNDGKTDTLLTLELGDDLNSEKTKINSITLKMLLSDPSAESLSPAERLPVYKFNVPSFVRSGKDAQSVPPAKDIEKNIEVRINNVLLSSARIEGSFLVWDVAPQVLAVGDNLVGVRINNRSPGAIQEAIVELLELHLKY